MGSLKLLDNLLQKIAVEVINNKEDWLSRDIARRAMLRLGHYHLEHERSLFDKIRYRFYSFLENQLPQRYFKEAIEYRKTEDLQPAKFFSTS